MIPVLMEQLACKLLVQNVQIFYLLSLLPWVGCLPTRHTPLTKTLTSAIWRPWELRVELARVGEQVRHPKWSASYDDCMVSIVAITELSLLACRLQPAWLARLLLMEWCKAQWWIVQSYNIKINMQIPQMFIGIIAAFLICFLFGLALWSFESAELPGKRALINLTSFHWLVLICNN